MPKRRRNEPVNKSTSPKQGQEQRRASPSTTTNGNTNHRSQSSSKKTTAKRKPSPNRTSSTKTANTRPKVPDPPASLVRLLQKDKAVLQYFTALQQNLDHDVTQWKNKALEYRSQVRELKVEVSELEDACAKMEAQGVPHRNKQDEKLNDNGGGVPLKTINIPQSLDEHVGDDDDEYHLGSDLEDFASAPHTRQKIGKPSEKKSAIRKVVNDNSQGNDKTTNPPTTGKRKAAGKIQNDKTARKNSNTTMNLSDDNASIDMEIDVESTTNPVASNKDTINNDYLNGDLDDVKQEKTCTRKNNTSDSNDDEGLFHEFNNLPSTSSSSSSSLGSFDRDLLNNLKQSNNDDEVASVPINNEYDPQTFQTMKEVVLKLVKVYSNLKELGISLIEEHGEDENDNDEATENKTLEMNATSKDTLEDGSVMSSILPDRKVMAGNGTKDREDMDADDNSNEVNGDKVSITRRSDYDVAIDIMRAIRRLIRFQNKQYQPFMSHDLIPCFRLRKCAISTGDQDNAMKEHPAANGFHLVYESLALMDLYCSDNSSFRKDYEWGQLLNQELWKDIDINHHGNDSPYPSSIREILTVAMKDRNITSIILHSIDGEISMYWPKADRGIRGTETVLVFEGDEEDQHSVNGAYDAVATQNSDPSQDNYKFSSKTQNRLFWLAERVFFAHLVSSLYHYRYDEHRIARLIIDYIISTSPSLTIENYPYYPPVMSICVLEALLITDMDSALDTNNSWFFSYLCQSSSEQKNILHESLSSSIHSSAAIWRQRLDSTDKRVRDMSTVEMSAYKRLVKMEHSWLSNEKSPRCFKSILEESRKTITSCPTDMMNLESKKNTTNDSISLHLSLLGLGDCQLVESCCTDALKCIEKTSTKHDSLMIRFAPYLVSCFRAWTTLSYLLLESQRVDGVNSDVSKTDDHLQSVIDHLIQLFMHGYQKRPEFEALISIIISCCVSLADGQRSHKLISNICHVFVFDNEEFRMKSDQLTKMVDAAKYPIVRVINLSSRSDRMNDFIKQARQEQLMVTLAVANFSKTDVASFVSVQSEKADVEQDNFYWGCHASDGRNISHIDFDSKMNGHFGALDQLVSAYWSPSDLKAFDNDASSNKVRMSTSERACALSHIGSWVGAERSLRVCSGISHMKQKYRISGYATGASILLENQDMLPVPVAIILEDDAILVDRFKDRIALILNELPRDFHFCSIGYGRPKNAAMIRYTSQLGIPTFIWYLTGYIISMDGARHLLESLPVRGPVDSWIGLKMLSNWDNSYGTKIGVGSATKAHVESDVLPSKKVLKSIFRFRSFAALTPLCSQAYLSSTMTSASSNVSGKSKWCDRDTDIAYSGRMK